MYTNCGGQGNKENKCALIVVDRVIRTICGLQMVETVIWVIPHQLKKRYW